MQRHKVTPHQRSKPSLILTLTLMLIFSATAFASGYYTGRAFAAPDTAMVKTRKEEAFLALARMGLVDFVYACSYSAARKELSWQDAKKQCTMDFIDNLTTNDESPNIRK